jgi:hypothetical protein
MRRRSWHFGKIAAIGIFSILAAQNDRETGKNCKCAAIKLVFRRNPDVV